MEFLEIPKHVLGEKDQAHAYDPRLKLARAKGRQTFKIQVYYCYHKNKKETTTNYDKVRIITK